MKKMVCLLFVLLLIGSISPIRALAVAEVAEQGISEEEYIYYSDLFYGYSYYLTEKNPYFSQIGIDMYEATNCVINEYIKTDNFLLSAGSHSIDTAVSVDKFAKTISDSIGLSNFAYNEELDQANTKFATELVANSAKYITAGGEISDYNKFGKTLKSYLNIVDEMVDLEIEKAGETITVETLYLIYEQTLESDAITLIYLEEEMPRFNSKVKEALGEIAEVTGNIALAGDIIKALIYSVMMQEVELELIQDIIKTQDSNSALYKGMTRLKTKLKHGFVSYFMDSFVKDKFYEKVIEFLPKKIIGSVGIGSYYNIVTGIVSLINTVALEWILDADYSRYTTAVMLRQYAVEMEESLKNQALVFQSKFNNSQITKYETLFDAYLVMSTAAIKSCEELAGYNTEYSTTFYEEELEAFSENYSWEQYLEETKKTIQYWLKSDPVITDYGTWEINNTTYAEAASDTIEKDVLYFNRFRGEIKVNDHGKLVIPQDKEIIIDGNVRLYTYDLYACSLINYGKLTITGSFDTGSSFTEAKVENYGELEVRDTFLIGGDVINKKGAVMVSRGDVSLMKGGFLRNSEGASFFVDGNVILTAGALEVYTQIENSGTLKITGELKATELSAKTYVRNNGEMEVDGALSVGKIYMDKENTTLKVGGNFETYLYSSENTSGTVIFDGTEQQTIKHLSANNIEVTNPQGLKYLSWVYLYGEYKLNGNPLDVNEFCTYIHTGCSFDDSDYKELSVSEGIILTDGFKGNLILLYGGDISIPKSGEVVIEGNVILTAGENADTGIKNSGTLKITGELKATELSAKTYVRNNGEMEVDGALSVGEIYMDKENTTLKVGGNFETYLYSSKNTSGTVIFDGTEQQTIKRLSANTIVLENESEQGVVFENAITPKTLFNHNGNVYTLYKDGTGSSFVDYDGDGLLDNADPLPTVGNPCTLTFCSADEEKGEVSSDTIDTIGGTVITVSAIPTAKYMFAEWIDESGKSVSKSQEYTFVARGDNTVTAYFVKRSRNITTSCEGGKIIAPSGAEIESEVTVTVTENEGYCFTENSLKYDDIVIENNRFIMPDKDIVLSAEFVRNPYYFALKEKVTEASALKESAYTEESFACLKAALQDAKAALKNNISEQESNEQIELLQEAMEGLACAGHSYPEHWTVVTEPTSEASGLATKTCTVCGHVEEKMLPYLKFAARSLSLHSSLTVNYKVNAALFEEDGYENPYVVFTYNGSEYVVDEYTVDGNRYVFSFSNVAANQMTDNITASLYATFDRTLYAGKTLDYRIIDYCYNLLPKYVGTTVPEELKTRTVLVDLLNYGAAAQVYTNYKTDILANASLTDEMKTWATESLTGLEKITNKAYQTIDNPTVDWKAVGLRLEKSVTIRYKITTEESIDDLEVRITSESGKSWSIPGCEFISTDGGYYVYFDGLNADEMSEPVYATVYNSTEAVSNTLSYSIESYVYGKMNDTDTNLANLVSLMMKYGKSAYSFSH